MATFKVGQRVKKIANPLPEDAHLFIGGNDGIGRTGVIAAHDARDDTYFIHGDCGSEGWALGYQLAPLTDPRAEQFIKSLKKLAREPMPADATAEATK